MKNQSDREETETGEEERKTKLGGATTASPGFGRAPSFYVFIVNSFFSLAFFVMSPPLCIYTLRSVFIVPESLRV
jgi:hypothetical protein